ncbi:hypothetical protein PIB30_029558 [Stylosanthes scabra]|uniref:Uncharacterized protein n=1 Tax=Stylosanthes scabra TaxID=79078 RepID=A0ABU6W9D9_9FABA|nr:hypothetical protein [Stylosanthes scabra]
MAARDEALKNPFLLSLFPELTPQRGYTRAYEESMCVTAKTHKGNDELGSGNQSVVPESEMGEGRAPERKSEEQGPN